MHFIFETIDLLKAQVEITGDYKIMIDAVSANNDPPHFRDAQTYYLFDIEHNALLGVKKFINPVECIAEFMLNNDVWEYACIPYLISSTGIIYSYSILSKANG